MPSIDELLRHLARTDVTELALAAGRLPCVKDGKSAYVPVSQQAIDEPGLIEALRACGGGAAVQALNEKPTTWNARVPGLGVVAVVAVKRGGATQARLVVTSRDPVTTESGGIERKSTVDGGELAPPSSSTDLAKQAATASAAPPRAASSTGEIELELDLSGGGVRTNPAAERRRTPVPEAPGGIVAAPFGAPPPARVSAPAPARASLPSLDLTLDATSGRVSKPPPPVDRGAPLPDELRELLGAARKRGATDVHLVADRLATFRVTGSLVPQAGYVASASVAAMLEPIVPPRLRASLAQSGSCDFAIHDAELGRFRVNVARQRTGLKGCFRLISHEIPQLALLGLPMAISEATHHHQGLVLLTGPTGSGKSTTLAALVDILNRETTHHIISIEDPIEHLHVAKKALLSQREVGTHTRSFEAALKASLREDPDVIVVGELRDRETVRMALTASETGHLVLATMNTPSAAKTIERLIDMFPTADQGQVRMTLAGGLRLIVGQRLVPSLQGGMVAAAEMLPGCIPLWSLIRENRTFQIPSLQQRGKQLGIIRLDDQLNDLVRGGRIALDAARFVAEAPETITGR